MNIKKDTRPYLARLWVFQRERAPLIGVLVVGLVTVGFIYHFSMAPLRNYLVSVLIVMLYLLQIRTSDEKKDFEHDNKYHPDRPVQRGVVTLKELQTINYIAIALQLLLYASFMDAKIMALGLLSQGYAFLTRKEFFVREWIRRHFFTYYISHYIQLVILFYAIATIINPTIVGYWPLVGYIMLGIILSELGRKMYPAEEDTTDDTYSAQLGHSGSAIALSVDALFMTVGAYLLIMGHAGKEIFLVGPVLGLGLVANSAYHYAIEPDKTNARNVEWSANLMYLLCLVGVILGS